MAERAPFVSDYRRQAEEIREDARRMMKTARHMQQHADYTEALAVLEENGIDWLRVYNVLVDNGFQPPAMFRKERKSRR